MGRKKKIESTENKTIKLEYFILILDESKKIGPKPLDFGPSIP